MAQRPKAKSKGQRNTDKSQSERFIETARKLGCTGSTEDFEAKFKAIVPSKKRLR